MGVDAQALLFGTKLRIAATVIGGLGLTLGGAFVTGFIGVPSVERVENEFGAVNDSTTEIETELLIHNPNPIAIRLGGLQINYTASMNGIQMASGDEKGIGLGTGNSTVNLTTQLRNDRIPEWWVSHIEGGERTQLTVDAKVKSSLVGQSARFQPANKTITTDILAQFNSTQEQPIDADLPVVQDPVLVIRERNGSWGEVTASETPIRLSFRIYNPKTQPMVVSSIGYNITMNEVHVGQGETEETVTIPGESEEVASFPTVIRTQTLDDWWVSHLRHNQVTELTIDFHAEVKPAGTDQTVTVPLEDMTYSKTIETDFFGNKAETTAEGDSSDDSDDAVVTTTTIVDDATTTLTTTDVVDGGDDETSTTTATNTTTDDGVLNRAPVAAVTHALAG